MIHSKYIAASMVVLATPSLAAYAPPEPVKSSETIVVTGQKPDIKELRRATSEFVRTATVIPDDGQYARRNAPLCPVVSGIDAQYADIATRKINAIATAAGAKVAKAGCKANLLVHFTTDSAAYIAEAKKKRPGVFNESRANDFANQLPIQWWYSTNARGSDGVPIGRNGANSAVVRIESNSGSSTNGTPSNNGRTQRTYSQSLIETQLVVDLETTFVVIDVNKVNGFPLDSVAAYAGMISLAQIRPKIDYNGYPSILAMFSGSKGADKAPRDLTEWDYAYLRALYTTPPNRLARTQRTQIFGEMVKDLAK